MARGSPDYGVLDSAISKSIDPQDEIVVASRGINSVDGLGRLYYFDDFRQGVKSWGLGSLGDGQSPILKYGSGEISDYGVYMYAGTDVDDSYSTMNKAFRFDGGTSIGVEVSFRFPSTRANFRLFVGFRSQGKYLIGELWVKANGDVRLMGADGDLVTIDTLIGSGVSDLWMPVKMVLNVSTMDYERVIVGQKRYTHENISPIPNTSLSVSELYVAINAFCAGAISNQIDLGHVIITTDEP